MILVFLYVEFGDRLFLFLGSVLHMVGDLAASLGSAQEFHDGSDGKESSCNAGDTGSIPGSRISLEKEMTTHSSILAWEIPWTEEPGKSMGSQRVRHD